MKMPKIKVEMLLGVEEDYVSDVLSNLCGSLEYATIDTIKIENIDIEKEKTD